MGIAENLAKILSSRYGKDVRQSIHDAIHECYEDGKAGAVDLVAREEIEEISSDLSNAKTDISNVTTTVNNILSFTDVAFSLETGLSGAGTFEGKTATGNIGISKANILGYSVIACDTRTYSLSISDISSDGSTLKASGAMSRGGGTTNFTIRFIHK